MLFLKFLTGPLAGKSLPLKSGKNIVGRAPHCDLVIPSNGISKEHATIEIFNEKVIVTDLGSRNGTFINGVQIKSQVLQTTDKLSFFDVVVELRTKKKSQEVPNNVRNLPQRPPPSNSEYGSAALQLNHNLDSHQQPPQQKVPASNFKGYVISYFEDVVLPGVYKLLEWLEFKYVLGLFIGLFIVMVTALSTIPLMRILKSSIEKEAQNRAQTIARTLVRENTPAIIQGQTSLVKTDVADREPGVKNSYIISNSDGSILAPVQWAGQHIVDVPFVHEARKSNNEEVSQVDDSTIVAVAPIKFYHSETGADTIAAHAVVVYNMGTLAVDNGRTVSLFVQILFIALILGGILYYFLYRLLRHPILDLNQQLTEAMRAEHKQIQMPYKFPELAELATNINSTVNRNSGGFAGDALSPVEEDRTLEMQNLINHIGFSALAITPEKMIAAVNEHFTNQMGSVTQWINTPLNNILDQSLKLNLLNITDSIIASPHNVATDHLEIGNQNYSLSAISIMGAKSLAYIVVIFIPQLGALE